MTKKEEKKEDFFTRLGGTIVENFLKQWKVWNVKTRILFILFAGFGLVTLFHLTNFILFVLSFFYGVCTTLWLLSVIEDIRKTKTTKKKVEKYE